LHSTSSYPILRSRTLFPSRIFISDIPSNNPFYLGLIPSLSHLHNAQPGVRWGTYLRAVDNTRSTLFARFFFFSRSRVHLRLVEMRSSPVEMRSIPVEPRSGKPFLGIKNRG
jgi:hypothetical protein